LRYFEGLSNEAAAERMQRTPGAIRKLTARALVALGKALGKKP
jgi:DNA-directed RNA polymerase specialized sigma24 family protein